MAKGVIVKDANWRRILKNIKSIDGAHVKVGVLADNANATGDFDMVALAATHEFGSPAAGVPERSFIRSTFRGPPEWLKAITPKLAKAALEGRLEVGQALNLLGSVAASKVRATITEGDGVPPPNAPSTIAKKGSDRPLVDTGRMLNAVTWKVFLEGDGVREHSDVAQDIEARNPELMNRGAK